MNIVSDATSLAALDSNQHVIAGAYQPNGVGTWRLYLTDKLVTEYHRCHPVVCNKADALQWIQVIAQLFDLTPTQRHPRPAQLPYANYAGIATDLGDDQP